MIRAIALDDEPLALKVIQTLCNKSDSIDLITSFTESSEALKYLKKYQIDLIFLDIQMPSISGIKFSESIDQNTMVIFTTAFSEYAVKSYEVNAVDYLLKPISQNRFDQAVSKAIDYHRYKQNSGNPSTNSIFIRADYSLVKILISDIQYIEGLADYLKIFIKDRKPIVTRMTLKEMLDKLPGDEFIRVHRSYILPYSKIDHVRNNIIFLSDHQIPIGKTYVKDFFERYKG